jgi:phage shock protein E
MLHSDPICPQQSCNTRQNGVEYRVRSLSDSRMKNVIFLILICTTATISLANDAIEEVAPYWIDVRTPAEYETGHLPGSRNINFDRIGAGIVKVTEDKGAPIVLYCRSGRRSGLAKQSLEQLGYTNVINAGGINDVLRRAEVEPATGPDCTAREC